VAPMLPAPMIPILILRNLSDRTPHTGHPERLERSRPRANGERLSNQQCIRRREAAD
jgi:hypothetical protein